MLHIFSVHVTSSNSAKGANRLAEPLPSDKLIDQAGYYLFGGFQQVIITFN